jgi:Protein of unknown function (DUF3618)
MMSDKPEPSTEDLVERTSQTRAQLARDVERLASALTPARLKTRAIDAAAHSGANLLRRTWWQLARSPQLVASYVRRHPVMGATIFAGAALATWRLALGRRR